MLLCLGFGRSWPGHLTSRLFADEKDHLVRASTGLCGLQAALLTRGESGDTGSLWISG